MPDIATAIAVTLSIAAFVFSLVTHFQQRAKDQRDLFLSIHRQLIEPDMQEGRRRLHALDGSRIATVQDDDLDGYQQINRALAMFDIFAMYINRRYIRRDIAFDEWGHALALAWTKAEPFIQARGERSGHLPWPHLRAIGPDAADWAARQPGR